MTQGLQHELGSGNNCFLLGISHPPCVDPCHCGCGRTVFKCSRQRAHRRRPDLCAVSTGTAYNTNLAVTTNAFVATHHGMVSLELQSCEFGERRAARSPAATALQPRYDAGPPKPAWIWQQLLPLEDLTPPITTGMARARTAGSGRR